MPCHRRYEADGGQDCQRLAFPGHLAAGAAIALLPFGSAIVRNIDGVVVMVTGAVFANIDILKQVERRFLRLLHAVNRPQIRAPCTWGAATFLLKSLDMAL